MRAWRANQLDRSLSNGWHCPTPSNLEMDNFAQFPFTNICKCKLCKIWIKKLTIVLIVSSHNDLVTLASDVLSADDSEQCGLFPCDRAGMPLIDHSFARDQITRPAVGRSMAGQTWKICFCLLVSLRCRLLNSTSVLVFYLSYALTEEFEGQKSSGDDSDKIKQKEVIFGGFSIAGLSWPCWHVGLLENQKPKPQVKPTIGCTGNTYFPGLIWNASRASTSTISAWFRYIWVEMHKNWSPLCTDHKSKFTGRQVQMEGGR